MDSGVPREQQLEQARKTMDNAIVAGAGATALWLDFNHDGPFSVVWVNRFEVADAIESPVEQLEDVVTDLQDLPETEVGTPQHEALHLRGQELNAEISAIQDHHTEDVNPFTLLAEVTLVGAALWRRFRSRRHKTK